ncbi:thioesterase family protein [Humitalea sp. 24SJ18S-53]|uniref:thioesterase family protein n=1 Tax=Humitalea sp. 24SJ18S-53 TaxID=3422307 RepID=UPI003D676D38
MTLEAGLTHRIDVPVTEDLTADRFGNAGFPVLATPALVGLMERCCIAAIAPLLEAGRGSVGTHIALDHLAATPVGMTVAITCTLTVVDRRSLEFTLEASDGADVIGRATHRRAVIETAKFLDRVAAKRVVG